MSFEERRNLDPCHCCEAPALAAPVPVWNRSGLSAVAYRVGTFASFRQAMFDAVAGTAELREWTTRQSGDYGIALLEMWAYLADILTFYHERGMNEALLRTALQRDSVIRLAGLLGYRLHPGVAATTHVAFTLEKGKTLQVPVGLRVQSVPGPGEKPQKFETVEAVAADARLNRVRIYPEPTARDPLAVGSDRGVLAPHGAEAVGKTLAPGDRVVMFVSNAENWTRNRLEEKEIVSIGPTDWQQIVRWTPSIELGLSGGTAYKYKRIFRVFGYDASETMLRSVPFPDSPMTVAWEEARIDSNIPSGTAAFNLDALYEDLKVGTRVLLAAANKDGMFVAYIATIRGVYQGWATVRDTEGHVLLGNTVTSIALEGGLPEIVESVVFDIHLITIYELQGPEILFWPHHYDPAGAALKTGSSAVHVPVTLFDALERDRTLILDDAKQKPRTVRVISRTPLEFGGVPHLKLAFAPALERDLDPATAFFCGNVAQATHGETVASETLGDGDASADFQRFALKKSPVTFVPDATAPRGAANTLELRVNGIRWQEAPTLYGQASDAMVFTTRIDDSGLMTVQFGDGRTGARLPTGRSNLQATYRQGLGITGRVGAGTLTRLMDRPIGLKAVTNPKAAEGGAEAETLEEARRNAPNTVRTFDRIVSLRDFEDTAREFTGIAKARAAWEWAGESRGVRLTVACDGGAPLGADTRATLVAYLNARRDQFRPMRIEDHTERPVLLALRIAAHSDYLVQDVRASVRATLLDFFAFDNRGLDQGLHLSDVYQRLHEVEGVVAADIDLLILKPPWWTLLLVLGASIPDARTLWLALWLENVWPDYLEALRRRGLRFVGALPDPVQPRLLVYPHELLSIQEPITDLWVDVRTVSP